MATKQKPPGPEPQWRPYCETHAKWLKVGATTAHQMLHGWKCKIRDRAQNTR